MKSSKRIKSFGDFVNETVIMKGTNGPKFDVTANKKSIAGRLEELISKMDRMLMPDLKTEVEKILKDPTTHASPQVRNKWLDIVRKAFNKTQLMQSISNLYLKAANLGVNDSLNLDGMDANDIFEGAEASDKNTIPFDASKEDEYSFLDESGRLVVDADFDLKSYLFKFGPDGQDHVLRLMPKTVESVGYLGVGDYIGWKITFKHGVNFKKAWDSLVDHDDSMFAFFQNLIGNINTVNWGFKGINNMGLRRSKEGEEDEFSNPTDVMMVP